MGSSTFNDLTGGVFGETTGERSARRAGRDLAAGSAQAQATIDENTLPFRMLGEQAAGDVFGSVFEGGGTPEAVSSQDVLGDPFFQALAQDQEQRFLASQAAGGLAGANSTQDGLQRNLLLLGNQFRDNERLNRQQDFQNKLAANQQRFGQLFNLTSFGGNVAVGAGTQLADLQTGAASASAASRIGQGNAKLGAQEDFTNRITQAVTAGFGGGF